MELSSQMLLFARVVEAGSFSAAARSLNNTPSAVSKQIGQLEDRLGVRLLTRTKTGIALTEEGRAFHARCTEIAATVSETSALIESLASHPQGTLRISATVAFGRAQIVPILPAFLDANPDLTVNLELTDEPRDVATDEIDVAIRLTEQLDDDTVIARKIAPNRRVICAAPAYVEKYGAPESPGDLSFHNCLRLSTVAKWNDWCFEGRSGEICVQVTGNFEASSADGVYQAAIAGLGIARLSTYLVSEDIAAGRLIRLLPSYTQQGSNIYATYADKRNLSPKVRALLDFLVGHFGTTPPWERETGATM